MFNPKIAITGSLGWLGKTLLHQLSKNNFKKIRCLVMPNEDTTFIRQLSSEIEISIGDIRNQDDCFKFLNDFEGGVLIHIAGVIHPKKMKDFFEINVKGTNHLLKACKKNELQRVVAISSNSPFGFNLHPDHEFDEYSPYNPYRGYGFSKMEMEKLVSDFQNETSIETVIIRCPWFYGPYQPLRQSKFFEMIRKGKFPILGKGGNLRSMAYVENLAEGILLSATLSNAKNQVYWIADEKPYSMNQIIQTVQEVMKNEFNLKCEPCTIRIPKIFGTLASIMDALLQNCNLYNQEIHVLSEMDKNIVCSITKAKKELGYLPKISLREGMHKSIEWCLTQGILI